MARPTILDGLSEQERMLSANMLYRGENWDTIFKVLPVEDTVSARAAVQQLHDSMTEPLSEGLYLAYRQLAEVDGILAIAAEKAQAGSDRHINPYRQLTETRIKLIKEIDALWALEEERGNTWEPSFDTDSHEFKVFKAAVTIHLSLKGEEFNDFEALSPEDQARFMQILAEGA